MERSDFPVLSANEVALLRSEFSTGIILDKNFKWRVSKAETAYETFENYEKALEYIEQNKRPNVEFVILNNRQDLLLYKYFP